MVYSDIYGASSDAVSRDVAMTVPPIKRGRSIIVGSVADLPLESGAWVGNEWTPAAKQPSWFNRSSTVQTAWHRMAYTLDDLIFHGWSLWVLNRSEAGTILDAVRVSPARWSFDQNTALGIRLDDQEVTDPLSVILFQGPDEGVLITGREVIKGARAIDKAWVGRVRNPIPLQVLQETEKNGISLEEAKALLAGFSENRRSADGAVAWLPAGINFSVHGEVNADLFIEGRNAIRLDVANLLNLPASLLDGSTATASLTYTTAEGEFSQLNSWLEFWLAPVEARLSADDITPRGQFVRFNRSNLSDVPTDSHGPEQTADPIVISESPAPEVEVA